MGVSIFLRTSGFAIVLAWGVCKNWRVCIFLRAVCKKIRASVKTFVKMSNGTVQLLGSRRPCLKTPIFTMKNEHFFYELFTRVCKISFCYPSLLKCYFFTRVCKNGFVF